MKVFKFGGASISTVERIKKVGEIISTFQDTPLLIIISAMGKTTNALENVVNAFYDGDQKKALDLFSTIKEQHLDLLNQLIEGPSAHLDDFFTEIEWLLHDKPVRNYDYYYDQVVCIGELLSSTLISAYLNKAGISNNWIDVRDVFRTDNNFRDAHIDWTFTTERTAELIKPLFSKATIVITQGFIGSTEDNESTTLGREGSDYSAAVFANILDAESQTIWKDVPGVMNADPKIIPEAKLIPELNYREVIEMAYYGAQVIHPKTIKPLQNKGIPLYVRSFLNPADAGTIIHNGGVRSLPPIIVYKDNQVLIELMSKDYSFVGEHLTAEIYKIFGELKIKPNLTQNAAISLQCVLDDRAEKVEQFALQTAAYFDVNVKKDLCMLTIRHYDQEILANLTKGKKILLQQTTPETVQLLMH